MEPDVKWKRDETELVFGSWYSKRAFMPHISIKSKAVIWPFTKAFRRILYYEKGDRDIEWMTEKEYIYQTLKGED